MKTLSHVWQMIRHNKIFYGIYIFGTALAIATVTVLAVIYWSKVSPVYPEYQRGRTCYIDNIYCYNESYMSMGFLSYEAVHDYFGKAENIDKVSNVYDIWVDTYLQPANGDPEVKLLPIFTDNVFFDIYNFDFLAGKAFGQAEFDSGLPVAVITEETARQAFGHTPLADAIGKDISLNSRNYRVVGIVRSATPLEYHSFANVYIPYTTVPGYQDNDGGMPFTGNYSMILLTDHPDKLTEEIEGIIARYTSTLDEECTIGLSNGVVSHARYVFGDEGSEKDFSIGSFLLKCAGILLVLMLVPAMNLSGMISGRMEARLSEMAVRKSFGATRGVLLRQVLYENLLLTVCGGILGYIFAYIMLSIGFGSLITEIPAGQTFRPTEEMMFSPVIFLLVFAVCCLLNLMSALIPAFRSLGRPIVESLKEK